MSNHREHQCNFQKVRTIGVILQNHRDYPCILLKLELRDEQMVSGIDIGLKFTKPVYFRYRFCKGIHRFLPLNTGVVPVSTGTEPYHTRYIRYRYPLLGISVTVFSVPVGTELIKSCSNVAMQVIALFKLLFIHTVSELYFV